MSRAEDMLEKMAKKGQIFRAKREGKINYSAAVYLPGIWEYQLKNLDEELSELTEKYYYEALGKDITKGRIPIFRVLPVDELLSKETKIMPYDSVKEIVRSQKTIALADCICKKERRLAGNKCKHVDNTCILFSFFRKWQHITWKTGLENLQPLMRPLMLWIDQKRMV
jgi:hypothetical protein